MKPIHVEIKNLGRVKDSSFDLHPLMLFSGESGLGKSYVALLCHYCYEIFNNPQRLSWLCGKREGWMPVLTPETLTTKPTFFIRRAEIEEMISADAIRYISYMLGNKELQGEVKISLPFFPEQMELRVREDNGGLIGSGHTQYILEFKGGVGIGISRSEIGNERPEARLLRARAQLSGLFPSVMGALTDEDATFVLPPSRGPLLSERLHPQSGLYREFATKLDELRAAQPMPESSSEHLHHLFNAVLEGEVKAEIDRYVYHSEGLQLPISAAAASIREIAPLEQLIKKRDVSEMSVLLEEPEAHLHPLKQRAMADIVAAMCKEGTHMQITTHSDYFLSRFNEIIAFSRLVEKCPRQAEALSEELGIAPYMQLNRERIGAFLIERQDDGSSRVRQLPLDDGVPFVTFHDAIQLNMKNDRRLEKALKNVQ